MKRPWARRKRRGEESVHTYRADLAEPITCDQRRQGPVFERRRRDLIEAIRRYEARQERRRKVMRAALVSAASVVAATGLAAGANAILSVTTELPLVIQPPNLRPHPDGGAPGSGEPPGGRFLRGYAASVGPTLSFAIGGRDDQSALAVSYASREGDSCLIFLTAPRGASLTPTDAVRDGQWTCASGVNLRDAFRTRPVQMAIRRPQNPVIVGFARGDVIRIAGFGPTGPMLWKITRRWDPQVPHAPPLRVWAGYPARLLDHLGPPPDQVPVSKFRLIATLRDGSTVAVRLR